MRVINSLRATGGLSASVLFLVFVNRPSDVSFVPPDRSRASKTCVPKRELGNKGNQFRRRSAVPDTILIGTLEGTVNGP